MAREKPKSPWSARRVRHYRRDDIESYPHGGKVCACGKPWPCADAPQCTCEAEVHAGAGFWHQPDCATRRDADPA
jgi:hypothetical protein